MKIKKLLFYPLFFCAFSLKAQVISGRLKRFWKEEVIEYLPYGLAMVFLVGLIFNATYFFGENRDIKLGIIRVFTFLGYVVLGVAALSWILTIKIG